MDIIAQYKKILKQFNGKIIEHLKNKLDEVEENPDADITEFTKQLNEDLNELGRKITRATLENKDKEICNSEERLIEGWSVEHKDNNKSLITVFGEIEYERRYYRDKEGNYSYLVDDLFGIENKQRMTPLVESKLVELSSETSYAKSGEKAVEDVTISDTTVMNKVHQLDDLEEVLEEKEAKEDKREVDVIYIEADEDHVALQSGKNTMTKLVYIHEGHKTPEEIDNSNSKLKNPKYIAGEYKNSEELWLEVADYLHDTYDMDKVKKVFIGGDGASWIREGLNWIPGARFVLDKFHLNEYIISATAHAEKHKFRIWCALSRLDRDRVSLLFSELIAKADKESRKKRIREARKYIYNQWDGIKNLIADEDSINPSAEGHVSHILSDRLSSRPMGWSRTGMDRMSRLRAFKFNGGSKKDILRLIVQKKREKKKQQTIENIFAKKPSHSKLINKYGDKKENIPTLRRGKVRGTYQAVKGLAR